MISWMTELNHPSEAIIHWYFSGRASHRASDVSIPSRWPRQNRRSCSTSKSLRSVRITNQQRTLLLKFNILSLLLWNLHMNPRDRRLNSSLRLYHQWRLPLLIKYKKDEQRALIRSRQSRPNTSYHTSQHLWTSASRQPKKLSRRSITLSSKSHLFEYKFLY